jgi:hypothetical protein
VPITWTTPRVSPNARAVKIRQATSSSQLAIEAAPPAAQSANDSEVADRTAPVATSYSAAVQRQREAIARSRLPRLVWARVQCRATIRPTSSAIARTAVTRLLSPELSPTVENQAR